jgi:hypothetical protein
MMNGNMRILFAMLFLMLPAMMVHSFVGVKSFLNPSVTVPVSYSSFSLLRSTNEDANDNDINGDRPTPPREQANLVNQARYLNSIETLKNELAKAQGTTYQPPENPPVYVLGRFEVPLRIDGSPGLDLTETEFEGTVEADLESKGGLVLVTGVTGNAADAGLQPMDTIVGVSCKTDPPFSADINSESLQNTAIALQTAVAHALGHNSTEIYLDMNRLISGYYEPQSKK